MTTSYDAGLAADRYITSHGGTSYSGAYAAQPYDKMPSTKPEPATLRLPGAGGISIHPAGSTTFQRAWAEAQNAAGKLDTYIDSLVPLLDDQRYTEANIREHIAAFADTHAAQLVGDSLQAVQTIADNAEAEVGRVRDNLMRPGDAAAELRNTRSWNRFQRTLDNVKEDAYSQAVAGLIKAAKPDEIGVLLQELPSYLAAKGYNDTEWIDELVAQAVPEYGTARRRAHAAQQALTITAANAKRLQDRYTSSYPSHFRSSKKTSVPMIFADPRYDPELI
ncbi:hypothetical protein [Mycolicibacter heraklionensis]|uniref:hypothetical protein n=1 Tax=Mycolicibacter heraklionensis TaxID=512402 RepID=UPI0007EA8AAC|nr:hypothetical protein [Mycolicibacter heraklionensis]OBG36200.1 hypothetical protein A5671_21730 [Mycolicibacter heraklionensis]